MKMQAKALPGGLALDVERLIDAARREVAQSANAARTTLYREIGARIRRDVLKKRRAAYGAEVFTSLGSHLERLEQRGAGDAGGVQAETQRTSRRSRKTPSKPEVLPVPAQATSATGRKKKV